MSDFQLTPRQQEVFDETILSGARNVLLYGGSRSGKTFLKCYSVVVRGIYAPGSRHLIARRYANTVKQSIGHDTLPKVMALAFKGVPYRWYKQESFFAVNQGSDEFQIWLGGLDDEKRIDKILGNEYATIYENEASEISLSAHTVLKTRLAQKVETRNGSTLSLRNYADLNPGANTHWSYTEFIENKNPTDLSELNPSDYAAAQMNPVDNEKNLGSDYIDTLKKLPEAERKRFYSGEFSASDEPNQVIPTTWVQAAMRRWTPEGRKGPQTSLGVDVALGGKDRLVGAPRYGNWFGKPEAVDGKSLIDEELQSGSASKAAGVISGMQRDKAQINIDANGNGAGVASHLKDNGAKVLALIGSRGSDQHDKLGLYGFANLRAEIHWRMREALDPELPTEKQIALPPDAGLQSELTAARYEVRGGKYVIQRKEDVTENLGRSPDLAEAVMNANFAQGSAEKKSYRPARRRSGSSWT